MVGPPARWMAASTPPPPASRELAALTIASTAQSVISPCSTQTRSRAKRVKKVGIAFLLAQQRDGCSFDPSRADFIARHYTASTRHFRSSSVTRPSLETLPALSHNRLCMWLREGLGRSTQFSTTRKLSGVPPLRETLMPNVQLGVLQVAPELATNFGLLGVPMCVARSPRTSYTAVAGSRMLGRRFRP